MIKDKGKHWCLISFALNPIWPIGGGKGHAGVSGGSYNSDNSYNNHANQCFPLKCSHFWSHGLFFLFLVLIVYILMQVFCGVQNRMSLFLFVYIPF